MPMHDWTRVDPNDYHDFHFAWIAAIRTALNGGLLPDGYYAMADHTTPPIIPDVVTLSIPDDPPPRPARSADANGTGGVRTQSPPTTAITATKPGKKPRPAARRRVAIKHARSRQIVAVVEIVSPSNKAKKPAFADLVGKSIQLLQQGAHVLLIDPFPPTARDPKGLHATVWKELTGEPFTPPAGKPLTLASYVARGANTFTAYVDPLAVGDRLPEMPLFITDEYFVRMPLEETYQAAWQGYPAFLRHAVEEKKEH